MVSQPFVFTSVLAFIIDGREEHQDISEGQKESLAAHRLPITDSSEQRESQQNIETHGGSVPLVRHYRQVTALSRSLFRYISVYV